MYTYRLEPIAGTETSFHWAASQIAPMKVWVKAHSEEEARESVTSATIVATRRDLYPETPLPPWKDFGLVQCHEDENREAVDDQVITEDGRTLPISGWYDMSAREPWK